MATDIILKTIMLLIGYFGMSRLIAVEHRIWGIFVAICIVFILHLAQSAIAPWPLGIPIFLSAYIAFGVGCKALYKPDKPKNKDDSGK